MDTTNERLNIRFPICKREMQIHFHFRMNAILLILMSLILEEANKQQASVEKRLIKTIVIYVRVVKRN